MLLKGKIKLIKKQKESPNLFIVDYMNLINETISSEEDRNRLKELGTTLSIYIDKWK